MERYSEVLGLPVICAEDGKNMGNVKDVIFCPGTKNAVSILLERSSCKVGTRVVLMEDILSIGSDAVVINDSSCIISMKQAEACGDFKKRGKITGLRIYSKAGRDYGIVKDVLFDYRTGIIEGVEVSDGLLQDIMKGRNILPLFGKVEFSSDNILVEREAIEEMTSTGGGIDRKLLDGQPE